QVATKADKGTGSIRSDPILVTVLVPIISDFVRNDRPRFEENRVGDPVQKPFLDRQTRFWSSPNG
ncbi:hypothetical protein HAX54_002499, partial [Datura stramonium]|nr:hypothetical protein [Datura stramonium]